MNQNKISPLKEIQDHLDKIDSKIRYLEKENDLLLKLSTELRKITSATTNELYTVSNDLLNKKRLNNNTLINKLADERDSKNQSIEKLHTLFEQLSVLNQQEPVENEDGLPIMDIREELDDHDNIISSSVKPQESEEPKKVDADNIPFDNKNEEGLPFMDIREELDEDGNPISGSVLPQVGGAEIESKYSEEDQIDNNQIMELFEDMGIIDPNEKQLKVEDQKEEEPKELTEFEKNIKEKFSKRKEEAETDESNDILQQPGVPQILEEDIIQLEIIADEFEEDNEQEEDVYEYADDEEREFEEEDEDDDEYDFEGNAVNNLLMSQINSLRSLKSPHNHEQIEENRPSETKKSILKNAGSSKPKKSVKFNNQNLEQVKEIENVSEELKKIDNTHLKKSLFKQTRESNTNNNNNQISDPVSVAELKQDEIVSETIKERLIVEDPQELPKIETKTKQSRFKQQRYPGLMTPVVDKTDEGKTKKPSRFKQEFLNKNPVSEVIEKPAAPINTQDSTQEPSKTEKKPFKKSLQSLNPKVKKPAAKISIPVGAVKDHIVSSNNVDDDVEQNFSSEEEELETDELEIHDTMLDYLSLQDDMDGMAKAYVLGLYDDDIATEGEVIDKLEDFEKINKIIELREAKATKQKANPKKLKKSREEIEDTLNEYDYNEDDLDEVESELDEVEEDEKPKILADQIVEREIADQDEFNDKEMESIDAPLYLDDSTDLSLSQHVLGQQASLQYNSLRTKLILGQNRFKKTDEELEFEPIDEGGNPVKVSRFKAAKLVHRNNI